MLSSISLRVFNQCIHDYHVLDDIAAPCANPFPETDFEHHLYNKNWYDTVQWHLEDKIRDPQIEPAEALGYKRQIDAYNQKRTDVVEFIDHWFLNKYKEVVVLPDATLNTETLAWAMDRLSILTLKIYHMRLEATRPNATEAHRAACAEKLGVLLLQEQDLSLSIDQLHEDIQAGRKYIKLYKQMKMYNDPTLNPVLYGQGK